VFTVTVGDEQLAVVSIALDSEWPTALSAAEREVAQLVLASQSDAAIARARGTSRRTVENQLRSIYRKLGVSSRWELVAKLADRSNEPDE
jgi:DNA-binding CsgD family transcriptional regulator